VVHVAPSQILRRVEAKDERVDTTDCVGSCYPYFIVFYTLSHI
jgi:hypothetical protein